jgi:hypothetical protein
MLISELNNDFYLITWDNPVPANSRGMLSALGRLGRVEIVHAKTTVKLWPKSTATFGKVRYNVRMNFHRTKGRAVIVGVEQKHVSHMDNAIRRGKWTSG